MKVKELRQKLQLCNPEYDVVLAQVIAIRENKDELKKLPVEDSQENDWIIRVDQSLNQVFQDNTDNEVCLFTSRDDCGKDVQINPEVAHVVEIVLPETKDKRSKSS
jgi:hypothetical protein